MSTRVRSSACMIRWLLPFTLIAACKKLFAPIQLQHDSRRFARAVEQIKELSIFARFFFENEYNRRA